MKRVNTPGRAERGGISVLHAPASTVRSPRARAAVAAALLIVLAAGAACAKSATVSSTPNGTNEVAQNETDPAYLASAVGGIKTSTTEATTSSTAAPPPSETTTSMVITVPPQTYPTQTQPPQTAPPQTSPTQTSPPRTSPTPTVVRNPPTAASGLSAAEQEVINWLSANIHPMTAEASLMNSARSGASSYTGGVSFSLWAKANVNGGGDIPTLMNSLRAQGWLANFGSCNWGGAGATNTGGGWNITVFCGVY